jgi:DNA ligase D-like protein (predicted polymerase)
VAKEAAAEFLTISGREVKVSNPGKVYFPAAGITKLELVRYYVEVGEGALRGIFNRPVVLKRYVHGAEGEFFFQKRAPEKRPDWVTTVSLQFPSGRTADEIVVTEVAHIAWMANLGCIDLNPHPVRANDLDHPDELRVDLDPGPGVGFPAVRETAGVVREVIAEFGLVGWPKTSGSRGIHVNVRIERRWGFDEVRRAALALAREAERRAPDLITSKWWKEERHGVFVDYNQNAKDRTVASAYSVRPTPDARVSAPLTWEEVPHCELSDFTLTTMPERYAKLGDLTSGMDAAAGSLERLLELAKRHEAEGLGDAPWPPHYRKQEGEPPRVQPSKRKTMPLVTVAKAAKKEDALSGLLRWKERHTEAAPYIKEEDVLVDAMRGRYTTWIRIRVNLRNVPKENRPPEETPDPDYDPWSA